MATDGIDIKPEPCFFKGRFKAIDYGNAGVKVELHYRGTVDADFLEPQDIRKFIEWLCLTTGQEANVLPLEVISVMERVIAQNRKAKFLKPGERKILRRAVRVLKALTKDRTPTGKLSSLIARAIHRAV